MARSCCGRRSGGAPSALRHSPPRFAPFPAAAAPGSALGGADPGSGAAPAPSPSAPAALAAPPVAAAPAAPRPAAPVLSPQVSFRYTGGRMLTARGAVTGRVYRFAAPGAVVAVDPRDAPGLQAVPNLRRV